MARPHEVTRLEGFSDAVFGFALTLLVVSLDVPRSAEDLVKLVRGSLPFGLTFAMVCYLWWEHNKFFRRYGLQDAWTAFLNAMLLFVILFYVYPLKFLTLALLGPLLGLEAPSLGASGRFVMVVYSAGVLLIFGLFLLLYRHAWRHRAELGLDREQEIALRFNARGHAISAGLAAVSIALAASVAPRWMWVAGVLYILMGPLHTWNGMAAHRAQAALTPTHEAPLAS